MQVSPRKLVHPVRLPLAGSVARRELLAAGALLLLAMAALSLPVGSLSHLGGSLANVEGQPIIPTLSFLLGSACLAAALWAAMRALPDTRAAGLGIAVLAVISVAQFGAVYRMILQFAILHQFYVDGNQSGAQGPTIYWGVTLVAIASAAFGLPLAVALANLLPHTNGPARYQTAVRGLSRRRHYLLAPIVAASVIVGVCAVLPGGLSAALGYSAPTLQGSRVIFPISLLDTAVWQSFARLAFLPLVVGMWEGMESARAFFTIAERNRLCARLSASVGYRLLAVLAMIAACTIALVEGAPLLIPGAIAVSGLVALSTGGALERVAAIPALVTLGSRVGISEDWRDAAPIGRVLVVLAAPALVPLCVDLWHGLEGPFRLPFEIGGYLHFWREFGIDHVPSVSIAGIFAHGIDDIALYSVGLIVFLLLGATFNKLFLRDNVKGLGRVMWLLVPIAAIAIGLVPIIKAASHPYAALLVGAGAVPALLLVDASVGRDKMIATFVVALALLGCWSYAVWHYDWLPPFAVLTATIIWRFLLDAGGLNQLDEQARLRRIAAFLAVGLLGLGMLVLNLGSRGGLFDSASFSDVTDRVAVAVIAPIWLVHYSLSHLRRSMTAASVPEGLHVPTPLDGSIAGREQIRADTGACPDPVSAEPNPS
jgi:hypothetical protein